MAPLLPEGTGVSSHTVLKVTGVNNCGRTPVNYNGMLYKFHYFVNLIISGRMSSRNL